MQLNDNVQGKNLNFKIAILVCMHRSTNLIPVSGKFDLTVFKIVIIILVLVMYTSLLQFKAKLAD